MEFAKDYKMNSYVYAPKGDAYHTSKWDQLYPDETIKEFEKEYPNVTIKYESGVMKDDYSEWLSQKALKGDLPDVFMVLPEDFSTFSSVGMLKNLDSYTKIDKAFKKSNYYEGSYDAGTYKGNANMLFHMKSVPNF